MVIFLEQGANDLPNYGPADATDTVSSLALLISAMVKPVSAYSGCPRTEAVKWLSVLSGACRAIGKEWGNAFIDVAAGTDRRTDPHL